MKLVVQMAREILAMERDLIALEAEVERLDAIEQKYYKLLDDSIKHSEKMTAGMVELAIDLLGGDRLSPVNSVTETRQNQEGK